MHGAVTGHHGRHTGDNAGIKGDPVEFGEIISPAGWLTYRDVGGRGWCARRLEHATFWCFGSRRERDLWDDDNGWTKMALTFEWDRRKAIANFKKHAVSFEEATTVFGDPLSITIADPDHSADEERFIIIGMSALQRSLIVVHTAKGERIRVVSARIASRTERKTYEEAGF